ncbi:hypothetical protein AB1N83_007152 [Pleurotus pulmonarius]
MQNPLRWSADYHTRTARYLIALARTLGEWLAPISLLRWSLLFLPVSLGLFFGLFFGLSYPETARKGLSMTTCHILASRLDSRYCCEKTCTAGCSAATIGAPLCSAQISFVNQNTAFSPSRCASDNSTCPPQVGQACDGGFHCCSNCCDTCQSCHRVCTGRARICFRRCYSYSCRCKCCMSTPRQSCALSCPTCYSVDLTLKFGSRRTQNQTTYHQDFGKNETNSEKFFERHPVSSSSRCLYNPRNPSEVYLDVTFTPWKWAVMAIFGILPLVVNVGLLATILVIVPACRAASAKLAERRQRAMPETAPLVPDQGTQGFSGDSTSEGSVGPEAARTLDDKARSNVGADDEVPLLNATRAEKL